MITAEVIGLQNEKVRLYARFDSERNRRRGQEDRLGAGGDAGYARTVAAGAGSSEGKTPGEAMQQAGTGEGFQFLFTGLPANVEYYVEAGPVKVAALQGARGGPAIGRADQVTYNYPMWTGLPPVSKEEHGGDLRAIEGTEASVEVKMDRPLKDGVLALDDGQQLQMTPGMNNVYRGTIKMTKDGAYHIAAVDNGQQVRLSEDYFIATNKANPAGGFDCASVRRLSRQPD